jgi:hypothetical protein
VLREHGEVLVGKRDEPGGGGPIPCSSMRSLPVVPDHPVRWATGDALLVLLGTQLLSFVWASLIIVSVYGGDVPDPLPIALLAALNIALWAGYGLGPVVVARAKGRGPRPDYGATVEPLDVPLGLAVGVAAQLVILPLLYLPILRLVDGDPSESARELIAAVEGPVDLVLFVASAVVMAPLVEELFYRGLLLRALQRRFGPAVALVVSAAVFAAVHRDLLALPGLFVFGLLAGWLAVRTGRLGPAWAMHVGFNVTTLIALRGA